MITAIIIACCVALYVFIGGVFGGLLYTEKFGWSDLGSFFAGVTWPLSIPALSGSLVGKRASTVESRRERREARKDKEHRQRMAELKAERESNESALALLRAEGVNV